MSDEIASATLSTSQKAIEVSLELIKMLAPMIQKFLSEVYHKSVDGIDHAGERLSNIKATGTVSGKGLMLEAQKANSPISVTSNFLARDADTIARKAKEYNIPIAIVGSGERLTLESLDRDKAIVEQITTEVMQERVKEAPQSVKCFSLNENSLDAIKAQLAENNIECQFVGGKNGKVTCIYPAENAEQVNVIREEYKAVHEDVNKNFQITEQVPESEHQADLKEMIANLQRERDEQLEGADPEEAEAINSYYGQEIGKLQSEYDAETKENFDNSSRKQVILTDKDTGKSVSMKVDDSFTKTNVTRTLQEQFGYSAAKAEIAANKACYDLNYDKEKFFKKPTQYDNINALKTNIRYESDDITIRDTRFDAVNFKDGKDTHIVLRKGDEAIGLTPAKMTVDEMKDLCIKKLDMSEYQADKAVAKAVKIESQVRSQMEERALAKDGVSKEMHIERTSDKTFFVKLGEQSKTYNFDTVNVEHKIAKDFDIPLENAKNAIKKAHNQSALQNKINNTINKKKKTFKTDTPKISMSKGMKKR